MYLSKTPALYEAWIWNRVDIEGPRLGELKGGPAKRLVKETLL